MSRDTKYNYTMEKLVHLIDQYCTFPVIEKSKLFKLTLFNFLVGNEDMHLKNFSVITQNGLIQLSPTYDLLNSTIVLSGNAEEIALSLYGKKRKLNSRILIDYFGKERCSLTEIVIEKILNQIKSQYSNWHDLIEISFLSPEMKLRYKSLLSSRYNTLFNSNLTAS
jgi:serine/threonine-protein kinase HipA